MNISAILLAMVVVGGTGLLIAILLGIASEKFKVAELRVRNREEKRQKREAEAALPETEAQQTVDGRQESV